MKKPPLLIWCVVWVHVCVCACTQACRGGMCYSCTCVLYACDVCVHVSTCVSTDTHTGVLCMGVRVWCGRGFGRVRVCVRVWALCARARGRVVWLSVCTHGSPHAREACMWWDRVFPGLCCWKRCRVENLCQPLLRYRSQYFFMMDH